MGILGNAWFGSVSKNNTFIVTKLGVIFVNRVSLVRHWYING